MTYLSNKYSYLVCPYYLVCTYITEVARCFASSVDGQDLNDGGQLLMWGANDVGQCGLPAKKPIDIASPTEAIFESGGNSGNFDVFF